MLELYYLKYKGKQPTAVSDSANPADQGYDVQSTSSMAHLEQPQSLDDSKRVNISPETIC